MSSIAIIAGKEFRDDFRNRWTIAVAILFAVLALSISYFGGAAAGKVGFTSFDATLASLTTLAAFVVPLIGLLIAYDMVVGEQDNGTLLLVLSYPISRIELVAGKFLGHCAALATATLAGFGVAVVIIQIMQPEARTVTAIFPRLLYLNPIDVFRLINLTTLGSGSGNELFMGMTGTHVYRLWMLYLVMLLWVAVPFALAQFLFRRKEV
jgi:ABC-type transport system involved in multi-copper enzyme maturation permease subunit